MSRPLQDVGASVRALLLERARADRIDFQLLLTRYVLERLLYRLSVSKHRDRFILKGALLLSVWVGDRFRPTRDLDLLGYGDTASAGVPDCPVFFSAGRRRFATISINYRQATPYQVGT